MVNEGRELNLPFYLTGEMAEGFRKSLKDYQSGKSVNLFQSVDGTDVLQGDCCSSFRVANLETGATKTIKGIALSNSCDISSENDRDTPPSISFAPTIALDDYVKKLRSAGIESSKISAKLESIRRQQITDLFYLPATGEHSERIAVLSLVSSMPLKLFAEAPPTISSRLSMLGFYLFLFKVSFHFCRMHEQVERST